MRAPADRGRTLCRSWSFGVLGEILDPFVLENANSRCGSVVFPPSPTFHLRPPGPTRPPFTLLRLATLTVFGRAIFYIRALMFPHSRPPSPLSGARSLCPPPHRRLLSLPPCTTVAQWCRRRHRRRV